MGTTPNYAWPYPELTDPPDGAGQIKALANAADTTVKGLGNQLARLPYAMAAGRNTTTTASGGNATQLVINFPAGRFSQPPIVTLTAVHIPATANAQRAFDPFIYALSATAFSIQQNNTVGTNWTAQFDFCWMAVQMLAGAAPGILTAADAGPHITSICHTKGCDNEGLPIPIPDPGNVPVFCGVCGHPVTDLK